MRLLIEFWPVIVPITIYLLWLFVKRKSGVIDASYQELDKDGNQKSKPKVGDFSPYNRHFAIVLYISLFVAIICFLFFAIRVPYIDEGKYMPAHIEDGKVIPGKIVK